MKSFLFLALLMFISAVSGAQSPSTVLVVGNAANAQSVALAKYYANARKIPPQNILLLTMPAVYTPDNVDTTILSDYQKYISVPVYAKIKTLQRIDYIVLCRNLPSKISGTSSGTQSVDSCLAGMTTTLKTNPYYYVSDPFSSKTYGMYMVTRLDGWSWADAQALVDNSIAAKPTGLFYMDANPKLGNTSAPDYYMISTLPILQGLKVPVQLNNTTTFGAPAQPLAGYMSSASDDPNFSATAFAALTFAPGAIAEICVSTSGSNIRTPGGWQSQSAQLVHQGVTGIKAYVAEPFSDAFAIAWTLFPGYVGGMNLAESFYSASIDIAWKDVVIGDPLCNPYAVQPPSHVLPPIK